MYNNDCFGINKAYYIHDFNMKEEHVFKEQNLIFNLEKHICEEGFSDFSKEGITSYFTFRYPILNHTMFQNVEKGDYSDEQKTLVHSWKPVFSEINLEETAAINFSEKLIIEALDHLVAGKKRIGVTLSGGVDSSLIIAMLKRIYPTKEIYSYSIGFYGEDEFEYSRQVAALFSDRHWEKVLSKEDFIGENSVMRDLISQKCAPLHPNELPLAIAEGRAQADGCEIVLCGEGADDIFGGYGRNLRMYLQYNGTLDYATFLLDRYRYFSKEELNFLIRPEYICDDVELVRKIFEEKECPEDLENKMLYFIQRIHTRGLIERGANALKYNGFEAGFPFACADLVNYANSIPFRYKVKWKSGYSDQNFRGFDSNAVSEKYDIPKYILKKVAERYLGNEIVYRKKYGFPVPFHLWFENTNEYELDNDVFSTNNISGLSGWKKFMVINLDYFIKFFKKYKNLPAI